MPSVLDLAETSAVLARGPDTVRQLVLGLPERFHDIREREGAWSVREVVAHLVHAEERAWIVRVREIVDGAASLSSFDRFGHLGGMSSRPLDALVLAFTHAREANLAAVDALQLGPAELALSAVHAELGPVRLHQLLATWVVHDLTHVRQIVRTLATAYADDVGPWRAYLSVLGDRA